MSQANLGMFEVNLLTSLPNLQRILNFYSLRNLASNKLFFSYLTKMKGNNFMKKIIILITLLSTMACTNTNINNSYKQSKEDFKVYQEISSNYKIDKEWWKEYNNSELNNIMNIALKNNSDLKKAQ